MPNCYAYVRVSTPDQARAVAGAAHGASIEAQTQAAEKYFAYKLQPQGFPLVKIFIEPGVSAEKFPLCSRPQGIKLSLCLERGDHVIFAKTDRGFRSMLDLVQTLHIWTKRGIFMHVLDLNLDSSTPEGRLFIQQMGLMAQWENDRRRTRVKEANAVRRQMGLATQGNAPFGFKIVKQRNAKGHIEKRLVPDPDDWRRAAGKKFLEWRRQGWSAEQIYFHLLRHRIKRPDGEDWSYGQILRYSKQEAALQAKEAEEENKSNGETI
jgi:DNA invertase Pin-like site-specific DNA recombinase